MPFLTDNTQRAVSLRPSSSARNVITPSSDSVIPITIRGAISQAADYLRIEDDTSQEMFGLHADGSFHCFGHILTSSGLPTSPYNLDIPAASGSLLVEDSTATPSSGFYSATTTAGVATARSILTTDLPSSVALLTSTQVFSGDNAFSAQVTLSAGTAALPSVAFTVDPDCGLLRGGPNRLDLSLGNKQTVRFDGADATYSTRVTITDTTTCLDVTCTANSRTFRMDPGNGAMSYIGSNFNLQPPTGLGVVLSANQATSWVGIGSLNTAGGNSATCFVGAGNNRIQLRVKSHSTQTASIAEFQSTSNAALFLIGGRGNLVSAPIASTALPASTEAIDVHLNLARTVQFSTGALTTQRSVRIQAPTYSFVAASTVTTASTVSISGAPAAGANATITRRYALQLEAGDATLDSGSLYLASQATTFNAGDRGCVGIGTNSPAAPIEIETVSTVGREAMLLDQNDADEPFIHYEGTSSSDLSTNVTSKTTDMTLDGFVRVCIGGVDKWMPFYTEAIAP